MMDNSCVLSIYHFYIGTGISNPKKIRVTAYEQSCITVFAGRFLEPSVVEIYYYYYYYYYYYSIIVSFIQGSHTHIPETNHVPRGYIVAAILSLLFMVPLCLVHALVLLFFYVSTFRSMCAVPNMAVFCSSITSWFPGMSLTYFLNDLEMVPVAPIITGITLVFTFHLLLLLLLLLLQLLLN